MKAEEARKLSKENGLCEPESIEIYDMIRNFAKNGVAWCQYKGIISSAIISQLERDGYHITGFVGLDNLWVTVISWK